MDTKLHQFQSSLIVMDISQQTNGNPKCFNYCFLFETNELLMPHQTLEINLAFYRIQWVNSNKEEISASFRYCEEIYEIKFIRII
jgi:hypothetical protein